MPSSSISSWPTPQAIQELVSNAQSGGAATVDALLRALRPPLVSYFARRVSRDTAEDLTQHALIRIARALPKIEPERADRFVMTVACNLLRTAYTQRSRDVHRWAPPELAESITTAPAADRHAEYEEMARTVLRIVHASLPPDLRDIILGLLRDETPTEIAARLGINPVTIRTRLLRARRILRKELGPHLEEADEGSSSLVDRRKAPVDR
jgi:RNA polymerase sigma-70 factor, ECF subfamily